ncbi:MAG: outer membrane beta-barrel protein [Flavobacteriales bacterium]
MKKLTSLGFILVITTGLLVAGPVKQQFMVMPSYGKPFLEVSGFYVPFFSGRNLAPVSLEKSYTEKFSHEFSYSTGINIGFYLSRKAMIQTGCWYSGRTYVSEIDGTFMSGATGRVVSRYMPNYLSIPLSLKIMMRDKVAPFFKIGAVADMLYAYSNQSNFYGAATFDDMAALTKTKEQFEKMRYSLMLSFGVNVGNMRKNSFSLQIEPLFIYSLSNDSEVFSSSYRPFYYGLSVSLGFGFTRKDSGGDYEFPDGEIEYEEAE